MLEGDPDCKGLFASNMYDIKPVHYLSMAFSELKFAVKMMRIMLALVELNL